MPVLFWLAVGGTTVVALVGFVGAALALALRSVSREVTELLELEPLAPARPVRARTPAVRV